MVGGVADGDEGGVETAIHGDMGAGFGGDADPVAEIGLVGDSALAYAADVEVVGGVGFEAGKGVGVAGGHPDGVGEGGFGRRAFFGLGQFEAQGGSAGGVPADAEGLVGGGDECETGGFGATGDGESGVAIDGICVRGRFRSSAGVYAR